MPQQSNYIYANSRASVLEVRLLNAEKYNRMIEAANAEDALKVLYESNFANGMTVEKSSEFEKLLEAELRYVCEFLKSETQGDESAECFLLPYDYRNAKRMMKLKYLHLSDTEKEAENGWIDPEVLKTAIWNDTYDVLPKEMADACREIDESFAEGKRNPTVVDITLDKAMYQNILRVLKSAKSAAVKRYFVSELDMKNILVFFRVKKLGLEKNFFDSMFLEGGAFRREMFDAWFDCDAEEILKQTEGDPYEELIRLCLEDQNAPSLIRAELWAEKYSNKILLAFRQKIDGVEPLLGYFLRKQNEINNLRLIFVGLRNDVNKDLIRERLRDNYE